MEHPLRALDVSGDVLVSHGASHDEIDALTWYRPEILKQAEVNIHPSVSLNGAQFHQ
jgi:hypothetical protein